MALEAPTPDGLDQAHDDRHSRPSFHSRLLTRSTGSRPSNGGWKILTILVDRWGWLAGLIGQGVTFAGGVAVGVGTVLFRRGEEERVRPEIMIGAGIGCVLLAIVAQLLAKEATRRAPPLARR